MAISDVSICNGALSKIGGKRITSLLDNSEEARQCNLIYNDTRDAVIRAHPWNCFVDRDSLTKLQDAPKFGFDNQFLLPSDCLRVLNLNNEKLGYYIADQFVTLQSGPKFKIEGRKVLTDDTVAEVVFLKRLLDPTQYDALFIETLKARLAAELAYPIAKNATLVGKMWELYEFKMKEARTVDGMEGIPDSFESDEIGSVRR